MTARESSKVARRGVEAVGPAEQPEAVPSSSRGTAGASAVTTAWSDCRAGRGDVQWPVSGRAVVFCAASPSRPSTLGLWQLSALGLGGITGAGIFALAGAVANATAGACWTITGIVSGRVPKREVSRGGGTGNSSSRTRRP